MLAVGGWALVQRLRRRLFADRWLKRAAVAMAPSGFGAVLAGWVTTEVGRQPYTVYGLMTTAESSSAVGAPAVATSLVAFIVVYFALFGAGTVYILRLMAKAPQAGEAEPDTGPTRAAGLTPAPSVAPHKVFQAR